MSSIWKTGVILLLVALVVPSLGMAWQDHSRSQFAVENESMNVSYSDPVPVDVNASRYGDTVTITNSSGKNLTDDDYDWNSSTGEVTFYNTSATNDGETVKIDYTYFERSTSTLLVAGVVNPWGTVLPLMLLVVLVYGGYRFATAGGGAGGL